MTGVRVEQVDNPQSHPFQTIMGISDIHLEKSEKYIWQNQRNTLGKTREIYLEESEKYIGQTQRNTIEHHLLVQGL